MKKLLMFLFCIGVWNTSNSQVFAELKGGYVTDGMVVGAGLDYKLNSFNLSSTYREYNIPEADPREVNLSFGFNPFKSRFSANFLTGTTYRWTTGEFLWENGVQLRYRLESTVELFTEYKRLDVDMITVGTRIKFIPNKDRSKVRFF